MSVQRAAEAGGWSCPIEDEPRLYGASPDEVLETIRECDDSCDRLLLAGHEPTWSELAGLLIGEAAIRFPTAAVARIDFEIESWQEVDFGHGILIWLLTPKLLKGTGRAGKDHR
jgi:phosphohistidine phosphatase